MSLKEPDDEFDELVPNKNTFFSKTFGKYKLFAVVFAIGLLLGLLLQMFYISPLLGELKSGSCTDCINAKLLLNSENECLYQLLPDAREASEKCAAQNFIENQAVIQKDYNEE